METQLIFRNLRIVYMYMHIVRAWYIYHVRDTNGRLVKSMCVGDEGETVRY